jgi:GNAT superfamily N-acetyltransferase
MLAVLKDSEMQLFGHSTHVGTTRMLPTKGNVWGGRRMSAAITGTAELFDNHGAAYFDQAWPVIRSLVVDPKSRGVGIGRALTQECIKRARRDRSPVIALHTSAILKVALAMYLRMGFEWHHDAPAVYGVAYAVSLKKLLP